MLLHGRHYTRRELEAHVGRLEQVGGLRRLERREGREEGGAVIQLRTGAGLMIEVTPDKGMDLSLAEFGGTPISWQSPAGDVHPAYYEPEGTGWLRTASGGLLMTCGLTQVGVPSIEGGEAHGLHGRIHHTPARGVCAEGVWQGDEYEMRISGLLEEVALFGNRLQLRRDIRARLGDNRITIRDEVYNAGFDPSPHMVLYHFNFGFPLLSEAAQLQFPAGAHVEPFGEGVPLAGYDRWEKPEADVSERVYEHELRLEQEWSEAAIRQPFFPVGGMTQPVEVKLRWQTAALPRLVQWRMPGAGVHALGLEPANCRVAGIGAERERGTLRMLAPGESAVYELELSVGHGDEQGEKQ
jgi:hypothetical protein